MWGCLDIAAAASVRRCSRPSCKVLSHKNRTNELSRCGVPQLRGLSSNGPARSNVRSHSHLWFLAPTASVCVCVCAGWWRASLLRNLPALLQKCLVLCKRPECSECLLFTSFHSRRRRAACGDKWCKVETCSSEIGGHGTPFGLVTTKGWNLLRRCLCLLKSFQAEKKNN